MPEQGLGIFRESFRCLQWGLSGLLELVKTTGQSACSKPAAAFVALPLFWVADHDLPEAATGVGRAFRRRAPHREGGARFIPLGVMFPLWRTRSKSRASARSIKVRRS